MSEIEKNVVDSGEKDPSKNRAGPGEGNRAPFLDGPGAAQQSIYDGAGNEVVVVTTTNDDGVIKQGTGSSAAEAEADAHTTKESIGEGFYQGPGH